MPKRKFEEISDIEPGLDVPGVSFKNSLDSDEDDDEVEEEAYNIMHEDEFEGHDDGPSAPEATVGFTAFNMKEELEEGYFDKDGHYLLKKEKQIRDNWLDNIDWIQIKPDVAGKQKEIRKEGGLADSDSDEDPDISFNQIPLYKQILEYLQPGETVKRALCRLGKGKKRLTTAERWKIKKDPTLAKEDEEQSARIIRLTELANELLTRTGNMDIYEETYEQIKEKIEQPKSKQIELDMYADDFDAKEKEKLDGNNFGDEERSEKQSLVKMEHEIEEVTWELKWSQNEDAEVSGPHKTEKMLSWSKEGYLKKGAWVRRTGQTGEFYSASRIDFDLYL